MIGAPTKANKRESGVSIVDDPVLRRPWSMYAQAAQLIQRFGEDEVAKAKNVALQVLGSEDILMSSSCAESCSREIKLVSRWGRNRAVAAVPI
ncbi:hypothetical protein K443DRAFT_8725 [Laccaria amethystina LaAM-08-1]|uniref:Uncharacterized protein n=1 Tax=Laccaria amethystina LaAM-08-1 TaxID=1095629 RepID=A0A0C9XBY5_9AGAR|nr:hypothetical protein K443DRAFT_8725 [Laccaria amethystina LaAM-08-1]